MGFCSISHWPISSLERVCYAPYNQVHHQQIGAKETTQNIVEIHIVQVIALEIPEFQIVERIQQQIVVIIKVSTGACATARRWRNWGRASAPGAD